ncbi:hypothetical protein [Bacillus thuringiensis]|uniref:hypothetical protein n=1 Tax=Bacillus thuringiensis TaxID=1428 RepID=UPI000F89FD6A|nr:hypothetical protein [Bacillus thuringiensis]AZR80451.1 hypothetical protein BtSCAC15_30170 [Bacillus thuringiensis]
MNLCSKQKIEKKLTKLYKQEKRDTLQGIIVLIVSVLCLIVIKFPYSIMIAGIAIALHTINTVLTKLLIKNYEKMRNNLSV